MFSKTIGNLFIRHRFFFLLSSSFLDVLVVFNIIGEENGLESQEYLSSPWLREHVTDLSCVT